MSQPTLKEVLDVAKPELVSVVSTAKDNFMATFGGWVQSIHRDRLEALFVEAGHAKIAVLVSQTPHEARDWQDVYETTIASIETLGLAVVITGTATAVSILKSTIRMALDAMIAVAAKVLNVVISTAIPGLGPLIVGPLAGAGLSYVLTKVVDAELPPAPPASAG